MQDIRNNAAGILQGLTSRHKTGTGERDANTISTKQTGTPAKNRSQKVVQDVKAGFREDGDKIRKGRIH